jgi:hypothetical protein
MEILMVRKTYNANKCISSIYAITIAKCLSFPDEYTMQIVYTAVVFRIVSGKHLCVDHKIYPVVFIGPSNAKSIFLLKDIRYID